jgi:GT2 family glycosyltransferase
MLVIDQSRDERTRAAVERAAAAAGATLDREVVHVPQRAAGRSRALNAGWPLARGEWVVIIDDDCEPHADWLAWLDAETRRAGPRDLVVGRVMPGPIQPGKAFPPATLVDPLPAEYTGRVDRDLVYPNIAMPRRVFEEIGPFDVRMGVGTPLPGGEDNDYGYRLLRAGWRILYRPAPTVVHCAWRTEESARLSSAATASARARSMRSTSRRRIRSSRTASLTTS